MKYDFDLENLRENDSHSIILKKIKPKSKILEFGPATGKMTKYLKNKLECEVDIVEYDISSGIEAALFAKEKFLGKEEGDIEKCIWHTNLKNQKYDYIIFADVLEHLRYPIDILIKANELLKYEGSIFVSLPNISHNSIIINLINGRFDYKDLGILDKTHLRFFTYESFKSEINKIELKAITTEATYLSPIETEFRNSYSEVDLRINEILKSRIEGHVYQYIYEIKKNMYCLENNLGESKRLIPPRFEKAKLYIKEEEDFEYLESKMIEIDYGFLDSKLIFDLSLYKNIKELRLDPTENESYFLDIFLYEIDQNNESKEIKFESNYLKEKDGYRFYKDPQLYIKKLDKDIKKLMLILKRGIR